MGVSKTWSLSSQGSDSSQQFVHTRWSCLLAQTQKVTMASWVELFYDGSPPLPEAEFGVSILMQVIS